MDKDDVRAELLETEHLLFFMGEELEAIRDRANNYREQEKGSSSLLAYDTDRCIDQLVTLQSILLGKILKLEKVV